MIDKDILFLINEADMDYAGSRIMPLGRSIVVDAGMRGSTIDKIVR